jgi:hypothetical protein
MSPSHATCTIASARLTTASYDDVDGARPMMATMRDDEAVKDVGAALDYLTSLPE